MQPSAARINGHVRCNKLSRLMQVAHPESFAARCWRGIDRPGWRNFGVAMLVLSAALITALFSAAAAQEGRVGVAAVTTVIALGLAAWVAIVIVPRLARRTSLRWLVFSGSYRLT